MAGTRWQAISAVLGSEHGRVRGGRPQGVLRVALGNPQFCCVVVGIVVVVPTGLFSGSDVEVPGGLVVVVPGGAVPGSDVVVRGTEVVVVDPVVVAVVGGTEVVVAEVLVADVVVVVPVVVVVVAEVRSSLRPRGRRR